MKCTRSLAARAYGGCYQILRVLHFQRCYPATIMQRRRDTAAFVLALTIVKVQLQSPNSEAGQLIRNAEKLGRYHLSCRTAEGTGNAGGIVTVAVTQVHTEHIEYYDTHIPQNGKFATSTANNTKTTPGARANAEALRAKQRCAVKSPDRFDHPLGPSEELLVRQSSRERLRARRKCSQRWPKD